MQNKGYSSDAVIKRGYAIYDAWQEKKISSRKIVSLVGLAVSAMKRKKTKSATVEALSYLFALDLRVKEKYNSFLRCLFFYFSWRREVGALMRLRTAFHFSKDTDVRTAIEVELQRLRKRIDQEATEDEDKDANGGKQNGKIVDETVAKKENQQEKSAEEKNEEIPEGEELEEDAEKNADKPTEQIPEDQQAEEIDEKEQSASEPVVREKEAQVKQTEKHQKEESNVLDDESGARTDKPKEANAYNNAVDSPPLYEWTQSDKSSADKHSFIDEVFMNNMLRQRGRLIGQTPSDDIKQDRETEHAENLATNDKEKNGKVDKDDFLYDQMMKGNKKFTTQDTQNTSEAKAEQKTEQKIEQKQEPTQKNENTETSKQASHHSREPIHVDITDHRENEVRRSIGENMSEESLKAFYIAQAEAAREQLKISNEELGINAPVYIIGRPDAPQQVQPHEVQNTK